MVGGAATPVTWASSSKPALLVTGQPVEPSSVWESWTREPTWSLTDRASDVLGRNVGDLLCEERRGGAAYTDVSLSVFVGSLVVGEAVRGVGVTPMAYAGHGVGEYAALVLAGVLTFEDGLRLVLERAEAMETAVVERPGTMALVEGFGGEDLDIACALADGDVWVAAYNGPRHNVLGGDPRSVRRACAVSRQRGARRIVELRAKGAFHTPHMRPAQGRLSKALAATLFLRGNAPVVANLDGACHFGGHEWRRLLSAEVCRPVRWRQSLSLLCERDFQPLIEIGGRAADIPSASSWATDGHGVEIRCPHDLDALGHYGGPDGQPGPASELDVSGEFLDLCERLLVSPVPGRFRPRDPGPHVTTEGEIIRAGDVIGTVNGDAVRSRYSGWLMGMLAISGERVTAGQPLAWVRPLANDPLTDAVPSEDAESGQRGASVLGGP